MNQFIERPRVVTAIQWLGENAQIQQCDMLFGSGYPSVNPDGSLGWRDAGMTLGTDDVPVGDWILNIGHVSNAEFQAAYQPVPDNAYPGALAYDVR